MSETFARWIPMDPQPPDYCSSMNVGRYHPETVDAEGMLQPGDETYGAWDDDWGRPTPHAPGDIINGCRVASVGVGRPSGDGIGENFANDANLWHWKIVVEPLSRNPYPEKGEADAI